MEESVRRLLSRLWLFQAAVFALLGYIPRLSGINCYCYNEPYIGFPICYWEGDVCSGDMCYIHKVLQNGVIYTTWNCLREARNHIDIVCGGAFNTATEGYICCKDRDNCNRDLELVLPIERPQVTTDAVTSAALIATTIEEAGSGSGSRPLRPSDPTDVPETSSASTSRPPSTGVTSTTLPISTPQPRNASLKCFCSSCPSSESSCGPNSSCYVSKDFEQRQDVNGTAVSPDSYSRGCFSASEAATKCQETDRYRCCSNEDYCNSHLDPPPLKCYCNSNSCPNSQDYVSCGAHGSCYVALPSDSTSTSPYPDSLTWGCFNQSEARVKCSDTRSRYSCCSNGDKCNEDLDPPPTSSSTSASTTTLTSAECDSTSGGCQSKQQQVNLFAVVAAVTLTLTVVALIITALIFGVLWIKIRNLKQGESVTSNGSASDSSENSVTTESESLPSPTSAASPHHYLHITTDEPAFGDSVKCNGSKA